MGVPWGRRRHGVVHCVVPIRIDSMLSDCCDSVNQFELIQFFISKLHVVHFFCESIGCTTVYYKKKIIVLQIGSTPFKMDALNPLDFTHAHTADAASSLLSRALL